jgi:HK97 gp10 family phage protein
MSVTITGLEKVMANLSPAQLKAPKRRFLTRVALIVERKAKRRARVKTGHMRRAITKRIERDRALVGIFIKKPPYPIYQEYGTRFITPNRFLRGGLEESQGAIRTEVNRFGRELAGKMGGS